MVHQVDRREGVQPMLDAILKAAGSGAVVDAPALLAGVWVGEGSVAERVGPYTGSVVSRARTAGDPEVHAAVQYAHRSARAVARLAPSTRAGILERASRL